MARSEVGDVLTEVAPVDTNTGAFVLLDEPLLLDDELGYRIGLTRGWVKGSGLDPQLGELSFGFPMFALIKECLDLDQSLLGATVSNSDPLEGPVHPMKYLARI